MKWLWGGLAAILLIGGGAFFLMRGPAGSAPPTLFQWQDYVDPHFTAAYEAAYHEKPATSIFADEDEALAKMRAGFKPDVVGPCLYSLPRWKDSGLIQPIDTAKLKNWNKIAPALRNLPEIQAGPGKVWFVPHYWGNTSLTTLKLTGTWPPSRSVRSGPPPL